MNEIIKLITEEIIKLTSRLKSKEHGPGCDPDASDDLIKELKRKIARLRTIRLDLEDLI